MTEDLAKRLKQHCKPRHKGRSRNLQWLRRLKKLGLKPQMTILEQGFATREEMGEAETFWIAHHRMFWPDDVTNSTDGGDGGHLSEESCQKIATALKGREHSTEHRQKIASALKGRKHSTEHRQRIALAQKDNPHRSSGRSQRGQRRDVILKGWDTRYRQMLVEQLRREFHRRLA